MGEAYLFGTGGGVGKAVAAISVEYPENSTITCVHTTGKRGKNVGTEGKALFILPIAGEWTVTATNGEKSKSEVVIVGEGEAKAISLAYEFIIYNGAERIPLTIWKNSSAQVTIGDDFITTKGGSSYGEHWIYVPISSIPIESYKTVKCTGYVTSRLASMDNRYQHIGFLKQLYGNGNNAHTTNCVAYASLPTSESTISLAIPTSVTGTYLGVGGSDSCKIKKLWLE